MRNLIWLGIAACVALSGCMTDSAGDDWKIKKGEPLPEFSLPGSGGATLSNKDLAGKPTYLAIFATWCPPCKQELKALQTEVWPEFQKKGGQILAVSTGEDAETVKEYVDNEGLTFPVVVDEQSALVDQLGGSFVPRGLVLDKEGKVVELHGGYSPELLKEIKTELNSLL